jgi:hypothetical protein
MSTLRLTTIANQGNTASVPSETVINGSAKAWVNFNGTSTVAIRASFNVTSITDNGAGDYTVNFTNAMTDANYSVNVSAGRGTGSGLFPELGLSAPTTSGVRVAFINSALSAYADLQYAMVSVFR